MSKTESILLQNLQTLKQNFYQKMVLYYTNSFLTFIKEL